VTVCDATVNGGITVAPGGSLDIENSAVRGSISASRAGPIRICGSSIAGALSVSYATSWVLIGDPPDGCATNTIGAALTVVGNHHGVQIIDNTVAGGMITADNTGAGPFPGDTSTRITGNHH
jgi:hypothetical protein